ncbi:threonine aldolase family protein [Sphingobacterium sp. Lzh-3]|uniref:threonine aldolase family protein n=1 Tax=unclassified Sphingobacterium TaxID=2609468 RepID=UPI0029558C4C|nr:aminotransferase class I/II-fold pyridoxal phosphate-dependent enzyme [Sphingobacterium sp. UGAL515B_05]WON93436.1 aminotransferase class I/II-fold pyridoxal phosphate-dependent enzyme [Sphingobacterium sp. UGAL515B_05]
MYNFKNDYSEGAHPRILDKLIETNLIQQLGYGEDDYSKEAKSILKKKIANQQAVIHFLSGGTQTNLLVISFLLRIHEAVISAKTGHISANETGAIEATGHKVITVETSDGKLTPNDISTILREHALAPHVVKPRIVYISNSTEIGTIYSLAELEALYVCCQQQQLLLYLDGARLGHALTAENNDLTFAAIARYTDVFYIGGTKNGALLGEAVVFNRPELAVDFDYAIKQKGALLAKGRVLSIQFLMLFQDDLYLELALRANSLAMRMAKAIKDKGYSFLTESTTNQIFPILPKSLIEALLINYQFYIWKDIDSDYAAVRLITSWATDEKQVTNFINDILNS